MHLDVILHSQRIIFGRCRYNVKFTVLNLFYLLEQVLLGTVGKSAWWQLLKG
jgi:hypothetical protein